VPSIWREPNPSLCDEVPDLPAVKENPWAKPLVQEWIAECVGRDAIAPVTQIEELRFENRTIETVDVLTLNRPSTGRFGERHIDDVCLAQRSAFILEEQRTEKVYEGLADDFGEVGSRSLEPGRDFRFQWTFPGTKRSNAGD
jgi:hypothetical protein